MSQSPELSQEQRAELVAYLDGELDEQATAGVEQLLARSPTARQEVELLERTWDLLDALPRVGASDTFTARTMSTIKVEAVRPPLLERLWSRPVRRAVLAGACVLGATVTAALGFWAAYEWVPDRSETLVREFPVIRDLDLYREVQDVRFLKQLDESGLLDDETEPNLE